MSSFSLLQNSFYKRNNKQTIELLKLGIKSELNKLSEDQIKSIVSGGDISKLLRKNNTYSDQEMSKLWSKYLQIVKSSRTLTKEENKQCDDLENQISKLDSDKSNLLNEIKLSTNNNKLLLLINKYKNTNDYFVIFQKYLSFELLIYDGLKALKNPIDIPTIKLYTASLSPALKKNHNVIKAIFSIINDLELDDDDVYEEKYNQLDSYILINNMHNYSQSINNKIFDDDDKVLINNECNKLNEISKDFIEGLKTLTF
jgi:hypothetical protein